MREFFIVVPLGLEEELLQELKEIEPFLIGADGRPNLDGLGEVRIDRGGIILKTEPLLALQLHFWLKTAARILLRLEKFHATEFYQLEKNLKRVQLDPWVGSSKVRLQVDATKSKLGQEKRIFEVAAKVWGNRLLPTNGDGEGEQLYLRAESDEFTLSLDLTGEHMHKRGIARELAGPAPIRETLAAALVRFLVGTASLAKLQGVTLLDPMAGSGTLLSEAANLYRPVSKRSFAFQSQPWIPKILKSPSFLANDRSTPQKIWMQLWAFDQHELAQERLKELATQIPETLKVIEEPKPLETPLWVVANPPYGERLEALPAKDLVQILTKAHPMRVAVILPKKKAEELQQAWPSGWQVRKKPVQNGGLPCLFIAFSKH